MVHRYGQHAVHDHTHVRRCTFRTLTDYTSNYSHRIICYDLLFQHIVTTEARTLLPHYLGMYRLTVNSAETYWIVMRNVFSARLKVHRKFDLKGSTVDRQASTKEKVVRCTMLYTEYCITYVCMYNFVYLVG